MKILYCTGALYNAGGAERVLINKANYLAAKQGYEVTIIAAEQFKKPLCFPLHKNVVFIDASITNLFPSIIIPLYTKLRTVRSIIERYQALVDRIQPDIIIVNELGYDDQVIPKLKTEAKTIREFHSSHEAVKRMIATKKSWKSRLQTWLANHNSYKQFPKFDCLVFLTNEDRQKASYNTRIEVIPNTLLSSSPSDSTTLKSKKVISVGRLDDLKNHKDQIDIWSKVVKYYPEWSLHIYGQGPAEKKLQEHIMTLGLQNYLFLEGVCTDLAPIYADASLFIFTSLAEGFGMVLIEAMSAGIPCVSYNCACGPSEIISDGLDGYLVPIGDKEKMADKIKELLKNDNKRIAMGLAAFEKSKKFLPENIMPVWESLFEDLVKK